MFYVTGWNMPGYLPEMEPASFATRAEAVDFLREEFRILEDYEVAEEDADDWSESLRDGFASLEAGHAVVMVNDYHYWIEEAEGDLPDDDIAA